MKPELLDILCCPSCGGSLRIKVGSSLGPDEGTLTCQGCNAEYPVRDGIPRMLPPEHLLSAHDQHTHEFFGHEWQRYRRWGWMAPDEALANPQMWGSLEQDAARAFWSKSLLEPKDITGRLVLDAGCGNGRYSREAAKSARWVVALDLTPAVDAALKNLAPYPNVHVVQGDLLHLPFKPASFDTVFTIGVLAFTENAQRAFDQLVHVTQPGGVLSVQFSHRGNALFELIDGMLRRFSSQLSIKGLMRFANIMGACGQLLHRTRLAGLVNAFVRVQPTRHHMFDWYSAGRMDRRSYDDVGGWFAQQGWTIVADGRPQARSWWREYIARPWALAVKGRKPRA